MNIPTHVTAAVALLQGFWVCRFDNPKRQTLSSKFGSEPKHWKLLIRTGTNDWLTSMVGPKFKNGLLVPPAKGEETLLIDTINFSLH